jgi:hypothetical protein
MYKLKEIKKNNIILIGESAQYINNSMFQQPAILLEDAYMISNLLIKEEDHLNAFELYNNSYYGIKVDYVNKYSEKYSKDFSIFNSPKFLKPYKILKTYFKSFLIKHRFQNVLKNTSFKN